MNVLVVIQARLGSQRLPSKVIADVSGTPMIAHVVKRCRAIGYPVVVAWPPRDLPEDDVLGRFWRFVEPRPDVDTIVRVTADCPLLDSGVSGRIIDGYLANRETMDFAGTGPELDGLDTEVFSRRALEMATVHDHDHRQHVTQWMREALRTNIITFPGQGPFRWSVDDQEGLEFVRRVFEACPHCHGGVPHHSNATGSIGGSEGRMPRWDIHAGADGGLEECLSYDIRMERVGGSVYRSR